MVKCTKHQIRELKTALRWKIPAAQRQRIHDLKAAYERAIGHPTSNSTVYNLLPRHGWRKLMPRPFHPRRDLAAQDDFKKAASHAP
jgi:Winged helix-turn helix